MTLDELIHRYLDPVEIVRPGVGDSTGDGIGDVAVVTPGGETTNVRLYGGGKVGPGTTIATTALGIPVALPVAPAQTVFRQAGRRHRRPARRHAAPPAGRRWPVPDLDVAASTGDCVRAAAFSWWESAISACLLRARRACPLRRPATSLATVEQMQRCSFAGPETWRATTRRRPAAARRLPTPLPTPEPTVTPIPVGRDRCARDGDRSERDDLAGADRDDLAANPAQLPTPAPTLDADVPAADNQTATLWLLAGTGSGLAPATATWSGPADARRDDVLRRGRGQQRPRGRCDPDGHREQPGGGTGVRYAVIRAGAAAGSAPETWLDLSDLPAASTKTVLADLNRDGRVDLVVDRPVGTSGSQFLGLLSTGSSFTQRTLWTNSASFRWSTSRIASADVDGDGRGDIVVLYNAGNAGSRLYRFLSTGTALKSAGSTTDPTLPWAGAAPY